MMEVCTWLVLMQQAFKMDEVEEHKVMIVLHEGIMEETEEHTTTPEVVKDSGIAEITEGIVAITKETAAITKELAEIIQELAEIIKGTAEMDGDQEDKMGKILPPGSTTSTA